MPELPDRRATPRPAIKPIAAPQISCVFPLTKGGKNIIIHMLTQGSAEVAVLFLHRETLHLVEGGEGEAGEYSAERRTESVLRQ